TVLSDGTVRFIRGAGEPFFDDSGKPIRAIGTAQDITERRKTEEELKKYRIHLEDLVADRTQELEKSRTALQYLIEDMKEAKKELEAVNVKLKELDRLKSIFLASMSHELRTPLNSIIGFTGIILMGMTGDISEEQRKQLTLVKNNAHHLLSLINDVLDISKIEAGKVELSIEEFSLNEVMNTIAASFSPQVRDKGIELLTDMASGIHLVSDKRRVHQILMNLISNAVKFTDQGSIRISARVSKEDQVEIRVSDTGVGIKPEAMQVLFQPFQQVDMSLTKKYEGTGLGLYLCKKLSGLLGGTISVQSRFGKGSEFTVLLPVKRS
ncbi:MAG: histidine kinase, partial [Nitrospirae bacterium CG_4_10_14_3_um_filter_53_41]